MGASDVVLAIHFGNSGPMTKAKVFRVSTGDVRPVMIPSMCVIKNGKRLIPHGFGQIHPHQCSDQMRARSEVVVFSDFLQPIEDTLEWINVLSQRGVRGSIVQVIDPAEESFPFSGRTEFKDPETSQKFTFGRAETVAHDYKNLFAARKEELANQCRKLGWNYLAHHTDTLASSALISLHMKLTGDAGSAIS